MALIDWNKKTLDELANHLEDHFRFSSSGTSKAAHELIDFYRKNRALAKTPLKESVLPIQNVSERTLGINSCAALIKSMPTDQAIQIMKSDITGQPETTVIDGQLVVAYVR